MSGPIAMAFLGFPGIAIVVPVVDVMAARSGIVVMSDLPRVSGIIVISVLMPVIGMTRVAVIMKMHAISQPADRISGRNAPNEAGSK